MEQVMKQRYYIDIPKWPVVDQQPEWENITVVESREEGEKFLLETWGIKPEHAPAFMVPCDDGD